MIYVTHDYISNAALFFLLLHTHLHTYHTYTAEFRAYFEHVRNLSFEDRPDYDYLKRLFRELFFRKKYEYDCVYDWERLQLGTSQSVVQLGVAVGGESVTVDGAVYSGSMTE